MDLYQDNNDYNHNSLFYKLSQIQLCLILNILLDQVKFTLFYNFKTLHL